MPNRYLTGSQEGIFLSPSKTSFDFAERHMHKWPDLGFVKRQNIVTDSHQSSGSLARRQTCHSKHMTTGILLLVPLYKTATRTCSAVKETQAGGLTIYEKPLKYFEKNHCIWQRELCLAK